MAILAAGLSSCSPPNYDLPVADLPRELQPVPGATRVVSRGAEASFGVEYYLEADYPAARELEAISNQISKVWIPRSEDLMNPGIPTSHVRGWTDYRDLTTSPESWVHMWQSEWQNASGALLSITLVYRSEGPYATPHAMSAPSNRNLRVIGEIAPPEAVEQMKRFAERQRKNFRAESTSDGHSTR